MEPREPASLQLLLYASALHPPSPPWPDLAGKRAAPAPPPIKYAPEAHGTSGITGLHCDETSCMHFNVGHK